MLRARQIRKHERRIRRATSPNAPDKARSACDHLITVPQSPNANTCWFNAILMILLFSDKMRAVTKKALVTSHRRIVPDVLQRLLSLIMLYKQPIGTHGRIYDKAFARGIRPEDILKAMYKAHRNVFANLPTAAVLGTQGANGGKYLKNMLQLLGVRANTYAVRDGMLYQTNELPYVENPDVVCVYVHEYGDHTIAVKLHPWTFQSRFGIGNTSYVLDASLMGSNNADLWHAIAGVTCNGTKFYYNGWQQRNVPCGLIPVDFSKRGIYIDKNNQRCYSGERRSPSDLYYNGADPQQAQCLVYVKDRHHHHRP